MARGTQERDIRVGGMKLGARFALTTTAAAVVVLSIASAILYNATTQATENVRFAVIKDAMRLTAELNLQADLEFPAGSKGELFEGHLERFLVSHAGGEAHVYQIARVPKASTKASSTGEKPRQRPPIRLVVPLDYGGDADDLLGLIVGIVIAVLVVVAVSSLLVAKQATRPLENLVDDIRQISKGDFGHRTRVKTGGEIALLARTVDRMASSLLEAQETEIELGMKEREMEVAGEVREALLPQSTPEVTGYDIAGEHLGSPEPGGDFHDYVETGEGSVGLLVCGVSGKGVPGALIGATARAYLRTELASCGEDIKGAFKRVNRALAGDVRRGMYVTALYALLETGTGKVRLACAGHKVPLIRHSAVDGKLHIYQPEGIALGFDEGPVFDRTLQISTFSIEPGDRIILANTGPAQVINEDGEAVGDKGFYRLLLRLSAETSAMMLDGVLMGLKSHAGDEPFPNDLSLVTVRREA